MPENFDPPLIRFCVSNKQREVVRMVADRGVVAAARELGVSREAVRAMVRRIEAVAAAQGYSPEADKAGEAPPGRYVSKKSTLSQLNSDGTRTPRLEWVQTKPEALTLDKVREALGAVVAEAEAKAFPKCKPPKFYETDLLTVYPIGDPHVGMFSWHEETGEDFDLKIAEQNLTRAIGLAIDRSYQSEQAILLNLGDLLHGDNKSNQTTRSGHALDIDSRWQKVLRVAIACMINSVGLALAHHKRVKVINNIGNHDEHSAFAVSLVMQAFFRKEPRVEIVTSPKPFQLAAEFGKTMITTAHGDWIKPLQIPQVAAHDFAEVWGRTEYRYHHGGHVHHIQQHEMPGMLVETHRTLAPRDSWHNSAGYRSGQSLDAITYHREFGEIERCRIPIKMLTR